MEKSKINYGIDIIMGITFIITSISGLIIFFFLPSGIKQGGWQTFLGITKKVRVDIHNWSGIIMIVTVFIHLILHRSWIVCMTKNICKKNK